MPMTHGYRPIITDSSLVGFGSCNKCICIQREACSGRISPQAVAIPHKLS